MIKANEQQVADLIVHNAKIVTLDSEMPTAGFIAVQNGVIIACGHESEMARFKGQSTQLIDAQGKTVIPGLNDSHTHLIRGGLSYNAELRWDGLSSLSDGMQMLKAQVAITPPPQWVRIIGGFNEFQFKEKRLPTLAELNAVAPETPVMILHLYDRALLNRAALRAVGYTKDTPDPEGAQIQRDSQGNPTGLLIAQPAATILYATLGKAPKLDEQDQLNSTRHFMRELNRLGITSVVDAGGGAQPYPENYQIIQKLHADKQLTVRVAYSLFPQKPGEELQDFEKWTAELTPGQGDNSYRLVGGGEMLVFSAADYEDFRWPRPDLAAKMEGELEAVTRKLVEKRWPFRIHATYEESITRFLDVFEKVNRDIPFNGLHWMIDHAETISPKSIDRIKALGGGIAIQHRMAYQGEYFAERYGLPVAEATPPVKRMLESEVPVGMGTDATRVASYNPWIGLSWLVTGKTVGGLTITPARNRLDRITALRLYTEGSAWFSSDNGKKGRLSPGMLADFAILSRDYLSIPEGEISSLASELTVVGGKIVHASGSFSKLNPPLPPASPDWSPVRRYGGYQHAANPLAFKIENTLHRSGATCCASACNVHQHSHSTALTSNIPTADLRSFWGALGCSCFAF